MRAASPQQRDLPRLARWTVRTRGEVAVVRRMLAPHAAARLRPNKDSSGGGPSSPISGFMHGAAGGAGGQSGQRPINIRLASGLPAHDEDQQPECAAPAEEQADPLRPSVSIAPGSYASASVPRAMHRAPRVARLAGAAVGGIVLRQQAATAAGTTSVAARHHDMQLLYDYACRPQGLVQ